MVDATVGSKPLANVNIQIRKGSDVAFVLQYSRTDAAGVVIPETFTDWHARSQIRKEIAGEVWHEMGDVSPATGITLDKSTANVLTVKFHIPAAVSEAWTEDRKMGVWDVELVRADGWVIPLAAGIVYVDPDVTRAD